MKQYLKKREGILSTCKLDVEIGLKGKGLKRGDAVYGHMFILCFWLVLQP